MESDNGSRELAEDGTVSAKLWINKTDGILRSLPGTVLGQGR